MHQMVPMTNILSLTGAKAIGLSGAASRYKKASELF
jgi:hypothetical protein